MNKQRRTFSAEFKREAAALVLDQGYEAKSEAKRGQIYFLYAIFSLRQTSASGRKPPSTFPYHRGLWETAPHAFYVPGLTRKPSALWRYRFMNFSCSVKLSAPGSAF